MNWPTMSSTHPHTLNSTMPIARERIGEFCHTRRKETKYRHLMQFNDDDGKNKIANSKPKTKKRKLI